MKGDLQEGSNFVRSPPRVDEDPKATSWFLLFLVVKITTSWNSGHFLKPSGARKTVRNAVLD